MTDVPWMPAHCDVPFPDPRNTEGEIVAVGGNLSPGILLSAYRRGIFPWYGEEEPILWWSLNPRSVLFTNHLHLSKSLRKRIRKRIFGLTLDLDFSGVIRSCKGLPRPGQKGTWITQDMVDAYEELHRLGYAHSVEVWLKDDLVGGLYGLSMGGCFFGESMFAQSSDASKVALTALVGLLADEDFSFVDCQQPTSHLASLGAETMSRNRFLDLLFTELAKPDRIGSWRMIFPGFPNSKLWRNIIQSA